MAEEGHENSIISSAFESAAHAIQHFLDGVTHGGGHGHGKETFFTKWFSVASWVAWAGEKGISRGAFLMFLFFPLCIAGYVILPSFPALVWGWLLFMMPIILVVGLFMGFWGSWIWYVQSYFIYARTRPVLLEVKMPAEITKSPRAMELVLTSLWFRSSTTTVIDRYWFGGVLPYYSLELVSLGGEVHFYIWASRDNFRQVIETNMYAQYPEVEIVEVSDYAIDFQYDHRTHQSFVGDIVPESYDVSRHEPRVNAYPIKTYVDFELDKDPKEEFKVEPFAQVLEVLSALNKDEQAWVQIVVRGNFGKEWKKLVEDEVRELRRKASLQPGTENLPEGDPKKYGFPRPTWKEQELMKSMERNLGKLPFDYGIRMLFFGPRGRFRSPEVTSVRWIFRPFANVAYQVQLRPRNAHNDFDWPWQDYRQRRWEHETHRYLDAYRRRQMWYPPWKDVHYTTSVEVLATLWHPPSRTIQTPGLMRIPSTKGEAPPNLPM